jgi:hypothetical protein
VVNLSSGPAPVAWSFQSMWAYGAHYRCDDEEGGPSHVSFDSGISHITDANVGSAIDVGILRSILLVHFGSMTTVLMEGSWIAKRRQGRANIKRDRYGFWIVGYYNREDREVYNPYVFPKKVSQVFFINDTRDSNFKVMLRHEPHGVRVTEEKDVSRFDASGTTDGSLSLPVFNHGRGIPPLNPASGQSTVQQVPEGDVVQAATVEDLQGDVRIPEDDDHFDDVDYEDELDLAPGDKEPQL